MEKGKNIVLDVYQEDGRYKVMLPELQTNSGSTETEGAEDLTLAPYPREMNHGYKWAVWGTNDRLPRWTSPT